MRNDARPIHETAHGEDPLRQRDDEDGDSPLAGSKPAGTTGNAHLSSGNADLSSGNARPSNGPDSGDPGRPEAGRPRPVEDGPSDPTMPSDEATANTKI